MHGQREADAARDAAAKAFAGGAGGAADATGGSIPSATLTAADLNDELTVVAAIVKAGFAKSNGEARRLIQGGGVRLHDDKVADVNRTITADDVRDGHVLLRVGKKRLFRFDVA